MYTRLSFIEREEISRQLAYGNNLRAIAVKLSRSASTISREVSLNAVDRKYYRAIFGQQRSNNIRRKKRRSGLQNKLLKD